LWFTIPKKKRERYAEEREARGLGNVLPREVEKPGQSYIELTSMERWKEL